MTETELQQLRQDRDRLAAENIVLKGQVQAVDAEIDGLRERHERLVIRATALESQLATAGVEAARHAPAHAPQSAEHRAEHGGGNRAEVQRQLDHCREQLAARETTIEYLLESRSWKMTAPLRALDRRMRGFNAESTGRGLALANFPIGRGLRLVSDVAGCSGDLWVGTELQFRFAASRRITGIVLAGNVPADLASQELRATVDGRTWTLQCGPGPFEWTVPIAVTAGASAGVHITAERAWRPSSSGTSGDSRSLAWRIRSIVGQ